MAPIYLSTKQLIHDACCKMQQASISNPLEDSNLSATSLFLLQGFCRIRTHQTDGLKYDRNEDHHQHENDGCCIYEP